MKGHGVMKGDEGSRRPKGRGIRNLKLSNKKLGYTLHVMTVITVYFSPPFFIHATTAAAAAASY